MAFLLADLLLPANKQTQLETALSNAGVANGLQQCVDEAIAEVAAMTDGLTLSDDATYGWIRAIALHKAYSLVGPVPRDVKDHWREATAELKALAAGRRPASVSSPSFTSRTRLFSRDTQDGI